MSQSMVAINYAKLEAPGLKKVNEVEVSDLADEFREFTEPQCEYCGFELGTDQTCSNPECFSYTQE